MSLSKQTNKQLKHWKLELLNCWKGGNQHLVQTAQQQVRLKTLMTPNLNGVSCCRQLRLPWLITYLGLLRNLTGVLNTVTRERTVSFSFVKFFTRRIRRDSSETARRLFLRPITSEGRADSSLFSSFLFVSNQTSNAGGTQHSEIKACLQQSYTAFIERNGFFSRALLIGRMAALTATQRPHKGKTWTIRQKKNVERCSRKPNTRVRPLKKMRDNDMFLFKNGTFLQYVHVANTQHKTTNLTLT